MFSAIVCHHPFMNQAEQKIFSGNGNSGQELLNAWMKMYTLSVLEFPNHFSSIFSFFRTSRHISLNLEHKAQKIMWRIRVNRFYFVKLLINAIVELFFIQKLFLWDWMLKKIKFSLNLSKNVYKFLKITHFTNIFSHAA